MKKKNLYTTSMATAILVASVATPIASASSLDEIKNFYGSTTQQSSLTEPASMVTNTEDILSKLDSSKSIYDAVAAFNEYSNVGTVMENQAKTYSADLVTNDDEVRRKALEKIMGISLSDVDYWGHAEKTETPMGGYYTTIAEMKQQAIYAINENRQALIQYGVKNNNWQPYNWFEAMENPSHFELVDGKVVQNKNYYAHLADASLSGTNERMLIANQNSDKESYDKWSEIFEREVKYYVERYNSAPGFAVRSLWLHHHLTDRKELNILPADKDYISSKWNNPSVREGKSLDGTNPFKTIIKGLQDGTLSGSLTEGYTPKSTVTEPVKSESANPVDKIKVPIEQTNSTASKATAYVASTTPIAPDTISTETAEKKQNLFDRIVLKVKEVSGF